VSAVPWVAVPEGAVIDVRLTPRGGRDALEGIEQLSDGRAVLKARVRAAPFAGKANAALCRLVAQALRVPPRQVDLASGATARVKRVRITGDAAALIARLRELTQSG
jgi:uncharacterized protein